MESKVTWNGIDAIGFVALVLWIVLIGTLWLPAVNGKHYYHIMPAWELWGFWYMDKPITAYNYTTDTFTFNYKLNISAGIDVHENMRADIFTSDCETHVGRDEGVVFEDINHDGEHVFTLDYPTVANTPSIFRITGEKTARADYCLRFSLWTGPDFDTTAQMINWIDTLLIIYFNFDGDLEVDFLVKENIQKSGDAFVFDDLEYEAIGYLCDPVTREPQVFDSVTQGTILHTCVELNPIALRAGLVIDFFPYFYWNRDYGSYNITQDVYLDGDVVDPLSINHCFEGDTHCHFDSLLSANFFNTPGQVTGHGQVYMKFGAPDRRRLEGRNLQDDNGPWREPGGLTLAVPITIYDGEAYQQLTAGSKIDYANAITPVANILLTLGIWILINWK